jgi:hypothetical protein
LTAAHWELPIKVDPVAKRCQRVKVSEKEQSTYRALASAKSTNLWAKADMSPVAASSENPESKPQPPKAAKTFIFALFFLRLSTVVLLNGAGFPSPCGVQPDPLEAAKPGRQTWGRDRSCCKLTENEMGDTFELVGAGLLFGQVPSIISWIHDKELTGSSRQRSEVALKRRPRW